MGGPSAPQQHMEYIRARYGPDPSSEPSTGHQPASCPWGSTLESKQTRPPELAYIAQSHDGLRIMEILHQAKRPKCQNRHWTISPRSHVPVDAIDDLTTELSLTDPQPRYETFVVIPVDLPMAGIPFHLIFSSVRGEGKRLILPNYSKYLSCKGD